MLGLALLDFKNSLEIRLGGVGLDLLRKNLLCPGGFFELSFGDGIDIGLLVVEVYSFGCLGLLDIS